MYFDNPPGGEHPPVRTEAHIHAAYRRLFTIVKTVMEPKDLTSPISKMFQGLFGAHGAALCHIFDDGARFVAAEGTLSHMLDAPLDFRIPKVDDFLRAGRPRLFTREQLSADVLDFMRYSRFASLIITPIKITGYPSGLVALTSDTPNYFTDADAETLYQLVTFMGMLLESREHDIDEQLKEHYHQVGETCQKIAPELHKATIELIQTFAQLRKYYVSQKYQMMAEHLANAVNNIENMAKSTQGLRFLGDICLAKVENIENIDIRALLENVIDYNRTQIDETAQLAVDIHENLPTLSGEFSYIWQAVHELIQNALQALKRSPNEARVLTIRAYPLPNRAVIEVRDNGCGVDPCDLPHLFEPFFTQWQPARGMGLTRARLNMLKLHGQLYGRTNPDGGMLFKIVLPDEQHTPQIEVF